MKTDLKEDATLEFLNKKFKNARHVWQDLLIEFGQDKYEETGFMIFVTGKWLKDFSKFCQAPVPKLIKILKSFADQGLITPQLFCEKIIFSENFLINHEKFLTKYPKKFSEKRKKTEKKLDFFLKTREPKPYFSMTCEEIMNNFDSLLRTKTSPYNNKYKYNNNINILDSAESDSEQFSLTSPSEEVSESSVKEFVEIVNEATNEQYDLKSWQYVFAIHLANILKQKDPNAAKPNLQEGARLLNQIALWGYNTKQIENVIYYFQQELNKASPPYPIKNIVSIRDFKQFFRKLFGVSQNGITTDYTARATEIANNL